MFLVTFTLSKHIQRTAAAALISLGLLSTGCADPVGVIIQQSIKQSEQRATQRDEVLRADHLRIVEKLRAEGDPLGEYLWVKAHEDQMIANAITDKPTLKKMYEAAAAKGSIDAQHKVGLMTFYEGVIGNGGYANSTDAEKQSKEPVWRKGLEMLERSTAKQCYHWGIVLDGMANRRCLRPVVIAREIWPEFRDGFGYPKNQSLANYWREKRDACDAFLAKQDAFFFYDRKYPACR